jgi:serine/threonine protein kinase
MPDFPESLIGKLFVHDWKIESILGEGKTAVVFLARKGEKQAAIKVFKRDALRELGFEEQRQRIKLQVDFSAKIQHPSLARIEWGGEYEGYLCIVMEYVPGKPLNEIAAEVPVDRIAPLLAQLADAAKHLEGLGVVHRDIKPANIVVDEKYRRATLLDYGVFKAIGKTDITGKKSFPGTLGHAPIEYLLGEHSDDMQSWRAITCYQLGTVAVSMITGKPLFSREENWAKIVLETGSKEPDLSAIRPGVPPELVALVRKCFSAERFSMHWNEFECNRVMRKPRVVFIYAGGTIGARVTGSGTRTRKRRKVDSDDEQLLMKFHDRVVRDHQQLKGPDAPLPFDLKWTHMPPAETILSENATPETWNQLARAVESICEQYAPSGEPAGDAEAFYLAGIVILHGTDTLSYSAASLSMSLRNLPCPVVLTGSNQPPNEDRINEMDLILSESDAWKNLLRCLEFIQAFGHRLTEVFVCFNDTVHVAVNLRKSAIDRTPQLLLQRERKMLQEPYHYRNVGPLRQYAWRAIDGLYCNNFYPVTEELRHDILVNDPTNTYRHLRRSPWGPKEKIVRYEFADGVRLLQASPMTLLPDDLRARDDRRAGFDVLLLEGYNSGTFPTADGHKFQDFLVEIQRKSIPVVLVTRNGLVPSSEPYEMSRIDGQEMPILRLFGLIAETAAPLLSLALADVKAQWNSLFISNPMDLLRHRHDLLEAALRKRTTPEQGGILSALLSDVLDQDEQRKTREGDIKRQEKQHKERTDTLFSESKNATVIKKKTPLFDEAHTILLRQHFLWLLAEVVYTFETANTGPDGLAFWNEFGFGWGERVRGTLAQFSEKVAEKAAERRKRKAERWRESTTDRTPFAKQPPEQVKASVDSAKRQTEIIRRFLFDNGVSDIKTDLHVRQPTKEADYSDGRLELSVTATKHGFGGRKDELFSTVGYRDAEAKFFRRLTGGAPLTETVPQYRESVEADFSELFARDMDFRVSPLDWFLIGCHKALACGLLLDLSFDPWVDRCNNEGANYVEALRQSIHTELYEASPQSLRFTMKYTGRALVQHRGLTGSADDLPRSA